MATRYGAGFQITRWDAARRMGLQASPSYYSLQNSLDELARAVREERLALGNTVQLVPWFTTGTCAGCGGRPAAGLGTSLRNVLIQAFANGATGLNMFTTEAMEDASLWLAVRDAVALATPFEDLLCDGVPAPEGTFVDVAAAAVASAMQDPVTGTLFIASSTLPYGLSTSFTVRSSLSTASWKLCNVQTNATAAVGSNGVQWTNAAELGSVLVCGPSTPCH